MLLDVDIENSANARAARQALMAQMGSKFEDSAAKPSAVSQLEAALAANGQVPSVPRGPQVGRGVAAGTSSTGTGTTDFNDMFKH
jgi:hypothetical protein